MFSTPCAMILFSDSWISCFYIDISVATIDTEQSVVQLLNANTHLSDDVKVQTTSATEYFTLSSQSDTFSCIRNLICIKFFFTK